jgi:hypothetical protein
MFIKRFRKLQIKKQQNTKNTQFSLLCKMLDIFARKNAKQDLFYHHFNKYKLAKNIISSFQSKNVIKMLSSLQFSFLN